MADSVVFVWPNTLILSIIFEAIGANSAELLLVFVMLRKHSSRFSVSESRGLMDYTL